MEEKLAMISQMKRCPTLKCPVKTSSVEGNGQMFSLLLISCEYDFGTLLKQWRKDR
jgi:hypothetical protein